MNLLFHGKVPKVFDSEEFNEDAYALSLDSGRIAVSDGATNSYDSRTWAELIVNQFVSDPAVTNDWINLLLEKYNLQHDYISMSWSQQAAFEKGSFASLIGVENYPHHQTVDVLAVGDSLAVLLDQTKFIDSFPYVLSEEFNQRPELLSTLDAHNSFLNSHCFYSKHHKTWSISDYSRPLLLCMTDALGQWALSNKENGTPVWEKLCGIRSRDQLQELVTQERASKNMKLDDVTFILVDLTREDDGGLSNP